MEEPLYTSISAAHRTISQMQVDGTTVRYALARLGSGDVYWRADTFAPADNPIEPMRWMSHLGQLTVADVIFAAPACEQTVRGWTRAEIEAGTADADWLTEDRRIAALERLGGELADVRPARRAARLKQAAGRTHAAAARGPEAISNARRSTSSSIAGVSRPVNVFCWLGWKHPSSGQRPGASAPWPKRGRGRLGGSPSAA